MRETNCTSQSMLWLPRLLILLLTLTSAAIAQLTVSSDQVQVFNTSPGGTVSGVISIRNDSAEPQAARLYLTDYYYDAESTAYPEAGSTPRSSAAWIDLPLGDLVTVPAASTLDVPFTVNVPNGVAGSYWSIIMMEGADVQDVTQPAQAEMGLAIRQVFRYTNLILLDVGEGEPNVTFANPRLAGDSETGLLTFQIDVGNDGIRWLRPEVSLELFDAAGNLVKQSQGRAARLLPGMSVRQTFELDTLPAGAYQAVVLADAGSEDIFGARYNLNVE